MDHRGQPPRDESSGRKRNFDLLDLHVDDTYSGESHSQDDAAHTPPHKPDDCPLHPWPCPTEEFYLKLSLDNHGPLCLPQAYNSPTTFTTFNRDLFRNACSEVNLPELGSMHTVETQVIGRYFYSPNSVAAELMTSAYFALVANFFKASGCKYFRTTAPHNTDSTQEISRQRAVFHTLSIKYYNNAIVYLKRLISGPDYELTIALVASSMLNRVALYECNNSKVSTTFLNGMLSIYDVLYRDETLRKLPHELAWSLNFLDFLSKSRHFPPYNPQFLVEFQRKISLMGQLLLRYFEANPHDCKRKALAYDYNNLSKYVAYVMKITLVKGRPKVNPDIEQMVSPPQLFELLRRWYVIMPPYTQIHVSLKHPMAKILGYFYFGFAICLDSIFPETMHMYKLTFNGGVQLYINFVRQHHFGFSAQFTRGLPSTLTEDMTKMLAYILRLTTFFRKRYNILAVFFGEQRISPEVQAELIRKKINEIMVTEFDKISLAIINYPYISSSIDPEGMGIDTSNLPADLFYYNRSHLAHLRDSESHPYVNTDTCALINAAARPPLSTPGARNDNPSLVDPVLRRHIKMVTNLDLFATDLGSWERRVQNVSHNTAIDYLIWFEWSVCKSILRVLEQQFRVFCEDLATDNNGPVGSPKNLVALKHGSWLLELDYDPALLATFNHFAIYKRRNVTKDSVLRQKIRSILDNERRRRDQQYASEMVEVNYDDTLNFYDDLSESLWQLPARNNHYDPHSNE